MNQRFKQSGSGIWRLAAVFALIFIAGSLVGCELLSFFSAGLSSNKIPAKFELADKPTAVLVDDPTNTNGDRFLQRQIASEIGFLLKENEVTSQIIDQRKLDNLRNELGNNYGKTAIDEIGRRVGADQVIYIDIKTVQYRAEPGMLRPMAVCEVKVIDATNGRRLFPGFDDEDDEGANLPTEGHLVAVTMFYRTQEPGGELQLVSKVLAERVGRDIARLFFEYKAREPGEPFE